MSKSAKKNGKSNKEGKAKKAAGKAKKAAGKAKKAAGKAEARGRLIALEGTRDRELEEATERLAHLCGDDGEPAGWSRWDASNTFYELRLGKAKRYSPSPRTLLLLYASDLLFRLRWEIQPALKEGRTVVAAPYVESAIGFGVAAGLSKDWLKELFNFAPKPDCCLRLKEKAKGKSKDKKKGAKAPGGFVEFGCSTLAATSPDWDPAVLRAGILKYLEDLEESGEIRRFGKKLPKALAKR